MDTASVKLETKLASPDLGLHTMYKMTDTKPTGSPSQEGVEKSKERQLGLAAQTGAQANGERGFVAGDATGSNPTGQPAVGATGFKIAMEVDPHDSPEGHAKSSYRPNDGAASDDMGDVDEGPGIQSYVLKKMAQARPHVSHQAHQVVIVKDLIDQERAPPQQQIAEDDENSLIHEGDSLVKELDNMPDKRQATAMTVVDGGNSKKNANKKSNMTTFDSAGYQMRGNTKLMSPTAGDGAESEYKHWKEDKSAQQPLSYYDSSAGYVVQQHGGQSAAQNHEVSKSGLQAVVRQGESGAGHQLVTPQDDAKSMIRQEHASTYKVPPQDNQSGGTVILGQSLQSEYKGGQVAAQDDAKSMVRQEYQSAYKDGSIEPQGDAKSVVKHEPQPAYKEAGQLGTEYGMSMVRQEHQFAYRQNQGSVKQYQEGPQPVNNLKLETVQSGKSHAKGVPEPHYPSHPRDEDINSPGHMGSPSRPINLQDVEEVHSEDLNNSNMANLHDSLENDMRPSQANLEGAETKSKFMNNFEKYVKDEAGMSVFAPADIDYSDRANRAEAHLMKYDSEIRAKYEKVGRGMQQIFSNIQKINIGAHESANRFKVFFQNMMQKTEKVAAMYVLPVNLNLMQERKELDELKPAGNILELQKTFETLKAQRAEQSSLVLAQLKTMKDDYKTKIVEENFYEEGIDQKNTVEMQKGIEKVFDSILKRNKKCIEQYDLVNRKIEENKLYFEKNKKFKSDTFDDYMSYLRSCRKLWMFLCDAQERLVQYWARVRLMEELRIKAITHILQIYFAIEEKLSSSSQNIESLKRMNSMLSAEGMAAAIYNDQSFLNSPLLESIGIRLDNVKVFTAEIKKIKNIVPDVVEFALWDYTNLHTLVKAVNTPLRVFRSNENSLYIYNGFKDRTEIPMECPLFKCKVNSLLLNFDERNNCITLKGSGLFNFSNFTFNLREHNDANDFASIVTKFCKNSADLTKSGIGVNAQK